MKNSPSRTRFIRTKTAKFAILALIISTFLWLKLHYLGPRFSDGHIYTYMGYLISKGAVPYRDFYYSSPPFLPYAMAAFGLLSNWHAPSADAIPIFLSALDGILIFFICSKRATYFPAIVATTMYLSSYVVLATSDFASDIHWIVSLSLLGWWAHTANRHTTSQILFALTALVKAYAIIIVGIIAIMFGLTNRRHTGLALLRTTIVTSIIVCSPFYLSLGQPFADQVLFNNLHRMPGIQASSILAFFSKHDIWIYPIVCGLLIALSTNLRAWAYSVPILLYLAFFLYYPDVYYLYLKPLPAYAAVLLGAISFKKKGVQNGFFLLLACLCLATGIYSVKIYIAEQANTAKIDGITEIVKAVTELAGPDEPIYGESSFTPLIALLANRSIFRNYIDTNIKFVNQGLYTLEGRASEIEGSNVKLILTKAVVQNNQIQSISPVLPVDFMLSHCTVAKVFPLAMDYSENAVLIWTCGPRHS